MAFAEQVASLVNDSAMPLPPNPFYPLGSVVESYVENDMSVPVLLASFASGSLVIISTTYFIARNVNPNLRKRDVSAMMWFALCMCIFRGERGNFNLLIAG